MWKNNYTRFKLDMAYSRTNRTYMCERYMDKPSVKLVVVCFIQRPSKYIETTHITTFGRKKGNSDKTRTVKACNIQPYNEFKKLKEAWSLHLI